MRPADEIAAALTEIRITPPGQTQPVDLGSLRDPTALRFQAACLRRLDPAVLEPILAGRWLEDYDVEALLQSVECPALLLQGETRLGGLLPDGYAEQIAARLRRGVRIRLEGVGHQIHWMQTEAMMRYVLGFLESLD
jgi:pimeloyl-ACP methyl ester carboxylesterase